MLLSPSTSWPQTRSTPPCTSQAVPSFHQAWAEGPTAPILCGSAATLSCDPWAVYDGGDHLIFIGKVVDVAARDKEPLLFYRSSFRHIGAQASAAVWKGSLDDPNSGWFDATTSFTPLYLRTEKTA